MCLPISVPSVNRLGLSCVPWPMLSHPLCRSFDSRNITSTRGFMRPLLGLYCTMGTALLSRKRPDLTVSAPRSLPQKTKPRAFP